MIKARFTEDRCHWGSPL